MIPGPTVGEAVFEVCYESVESGPATTKNEISVYLHSCTILTNDKIRVTAPHPPT